MKKKENTVMEDEAAKSVKYMCNYRDAEVQTDLELLKNCWEKKKSNHDTSIDGGSSCSICLESWTTEPDHRVVSLKCGHIFGESCINRWLKEAKTDGGPKCPTCKSKARLTDIRLIYPKSIKQVNQEIIEKYTKEVEKNRAERLTAEASLNRIFEQIKDKIDELETIKQLAASEEEEFAQLFSTERERLAVANSLKARCQLLTLNKRIDLEPRSESRVMACSDMIGVIVVAQKKESPLFPNYGLKNLATADLRQNEFIPLHKAQIKDACFHPYDALVLTASLDKSVKLTNIYSSSAVSTYNFDDAAWSCCWNEKDPQYFYVGLKNGKVFEYDLRVTGQALNEISTSDKMPCCSLQYVLNGRMEGVISTRLRSSDFHLKQNSSRYTTHPLPVQGNFMSSHYERRSSNLLLSSRPFKGSTNLTHSVYNLSFNSDPFDQEEINCIPVNKFLGGTRADQVMKGRIFPHPNDEKCCLVCAGDQDIGGFIVWDTGTNNVYQKIGGISPVFDLSLVIQCNSKQALNALTENRLYSYKYGSKDFKRL